MTNDNADLKARTVKIGLAPPDRRTAPDPPSTLVAAFDSLDDADTFRTAAQHVYRLMREAGVHPMWARPAVFRLVHAAHLTSHLHVRTGEVHFTHTIDVTTSFTRINEGTHDD
jgi:hypothetical protein